MNTLYPQNKTDSQFGSNLIVVSPRVIAIGSFSPQLSYISVFTDVNSTGNSWIQTATLYPPTVGIGSLYGWKLSSENETIVVGSPGLTSAGPLSPGSFYYYKEYPQLSGKWILNNTLTNFLMGCGHAYSDTFTLISTCPSTSSHGNAQLSFNHTTVALWHYPTPTPTKPLTLDISLAISDSWAAIGLPQTHDVYIYDLSFIYSILQNSDNVNSIIQYGLLSPTNEFHLNPSVPILSSDVFATSLAFDRFDNGTYNLYVATPIFQSTGVILVYQYMLNFFDPDQSFDWVLVNVILPSDNNLYLYWGNSFAIHHETHDVILSSGYQIFFDNNNNLPISVLAEVFFFNASNLGGVVIIIVESPTTLPTYLPTIQQKKKSSNSDSILEKSSFLLPLIIALSVGIGILIILTIFFLFKGHSIFNKRKIGNSAGSQTV